MTDQIYHTPEPDPISVAIFSAECDLKLATFRRDDTQWPDLDLDHAERAMRRLQPAVRKRVRSLVKELALEIGDPVLAVDLVSICLDQISDDRDRAGAA